jgi:septal ring factor EnvC (AmiA/AmiB activator)
MPDTQSWLTVGGGVVMAIVTGYFGLKTHNEGVKAAAESSSATVEIARVQADAAAHSKAQDHAMEWVERQSDEIKQLRNALLSKEESEDKLRLEIAELRAVCEQLKRDLADITHAVADAGLEIKRLSLRPVNPSDRRIVDAGAPDGVEQRQT